MIEKFIKVVRYNIKNSCKIITVIASNFESNYYRCKYIRVIKPYCKKNFFSNIVITDRALP